MKFRRGREPVEGKLFYRITGGCDGCEAYTDLLDHGGNVFSLAIHHEDACPDFAGLTTTTSART